MVFKNEDGKIWEKCSRKMDMGDYCPTYVGK
jgi:hypothetical protein